MEYYQIIILTFVGIFVSSSAILWEKPDVITVTEENQEEFALPIGTNLVLDNGTELYTPPPLARNFTADDRMEIQWFNKNTRYNYCKLGSASDLTEWGKWLQMAIYSWCRDKDGEDMCCGNKKCSCNWFQANCACVSPKQFDYFENKKVEDLQTYLLVANKVADKVADKYLQTTAKPKDGDKKADEKAEIPKDGDKKADEQAEIPKGDDKKADEEADKPEDGEKGAV